MKTKLFKNYALKLQENLMLEKWESIALLAESLRNAWEKGTRVYLCGNGGSAGNAMHIANDLLYGISKSDGIGLRAIALTSNSPIVTCLANDISYDEVFSQQLSVLGEKDDILIVLSGSGNSANAIKAIEKAKELGMKTFALLGYSGGKCLSLADVPIHFGIDDMQISEDLQLIVGHMLMQWLRENPANK